MDNNKTVYISVFKSLKRKGRELLLSGENYIVFLLSLVVSTAIAFIPIYIYSYLSEIVIGAYRIVNTALVVILETFVALPVISGAFRMYILAANRKEFCFADIFYAFTSGKRYLRIMAVELIAYIAFSTPFAVGAAISEGLKVLLLQAKLKEFPAVSLATAAGVFFSLLLLPLANRFYPFASLALRDEGNLITALKNSWKYTKRRSLNLILFQLSFVFAVILSAIPICLPLIFYTIPYMICSYGMMCKYIESAYNEHIYECQNKIRSEEPEILSESTENAKNNCVEEINE